MELDEKKTAEAEEVAKTAPSEAAEDINNETKPSEQTEPAQDPFELYPMRYAKFKTFYLGIVIISFVGFMGAICAAIYKDLLWGAIIAAISFFVYLVFTSNELIERLGLSYKTSVGSLELTYCCKKYGDVFFIPSRLLWYDVERIGDNAFRSEKNAGLKEIYIPASIKSIGKDAFAACADLKAVRFEGSRDEWESIANESDLTGIEVSFGASFPPIPKKKK